MVLDKSAVKIRLESQSGDKVSFGDVGSGVRVSCTTAGKLTQLDTNGDGELSLQDLIDSLDQQAQQKHQLKFQRYIIIAGVMLLLCSFGMSLGSSVLSFMLMAQMEVRDGAFIDRQGHVVGSQPRNPIVSNVTGDENTHRRLEASANDSTIDVDVVDGHLTVPRGDYMESLAAYRHGASEFVVPIQDTTHTVRIISASDSGAHGRAESGTEWWVNCKDDTPHCSVTIPQLYIRAAPTTNSGADRRLDLFDKQAAFAAGCGEGKIVNPGWEVGWCEMDLGWPLGRYPNPACKTGWCWSRCCFPDERSYWWGVWNIRGRAAR